MTAYQVRLILRAMCDVHTKQELLDGDEVRMHLTSVGLPDRFADLLIQEAIALKCVGDEIPSGLELMQ